MYCKKCGKEIPDDSIYCNHCGTRQIPKKIIVEFNKPTMPSINEDSIRSGIFRLFGFLRRCIVSLKPVVLHLLLIGLVCGATYVVVYYSYYRLNLPPQANLSEIALYSENRRVNILDDNPPGTWTWQGTDNYRNPSEILPDCKWDLDDDMIDDKCRWFQEDFIDVNQFRKEFLKHKAADNASFISLIGFCLCLLYYFIRLVIKFRKWLYKI